MTAKVLKFEAKLVPKILSGEKTTTWRLFDDKDLKVGDNLIFANKETSEEFAKAVITEVHETELQNVADSDYEGHEKYRNKDELFAAFKKYYGLKVTPTSILKVVRFKLIQ